MKFCQSYDNTTQELSSTLTHTCVYSLHMIVLTGTHTRRKQRTLTSGHRAICAYENRCFSYATYACDT